MIDKIYVICPYVFFTMVPTITYIHHTLIDAQLNAHLLENEGHSTEEDKEDESANEFPPWKRTSIESESTEEESETNDDDEGRMIDLPYGLFDD